MKPCERRAEILNRMAERRFVTAPELMEELQASRSAIDRDMKRLMQAGYPIYSIQGKGGGYAVVEGCLIYHSHLNSAQEAFLRSLTTRLQLDEKERGIAESILKDFSRKRML